MAKTLFADYQPHYKTVKIPQNLDASGTGYRIGSGADVLLDVNGDNYTDTDINAIALAALRWIATGTENNISAFTSSTETTKQSWQLLNA